MTDMVVKDLMVSNARVLCEIDFNKLKNKTVFYRFNSNYLRKLLKLTALDHHVDLMICPFKINIFTRKQDTAILIMRKQNQKEYFSLSGIMKDKERFNKSK